MRTIAILLASASLACAQASLAPIGLQFFDASGRVLSGGKIYTCVAGATCPGTPLTTYVDKTGAVAATNPIILDSGGKAATNGQNGIWIGQGLYKFVIQTSAGVLVRTYDGVGTGIADPGANGVMYRSAVNTTRVATLADMQALGVLSLDGSAAPVDNELLSFNLSTGLLRASGVVTSGGAIGTGTNGTVFTFTEAAAPTAPAAGKWSWYVDSTSHAAKAVGNAATWYIGMFTTPGVSGDIVLWDSTAGFVDGGPPASPYPAIADASPINWDVGKKAVSNASTTLNHATASRTLNMVNMVNGGFYTIIVDQDATGGASLLGGSGCFWVTPGGTGTGLLPIVTIANQVSTISITYDGGRCYALIANYTGM